MMLDSLYSRYFIVAAFCAVLLLFASAPPLLASTALPGNSTDAAEIQLAQYQLLDPQPRVLETPRRGPAQQRERSLHVPDVSDEGGLAVELEEAPLEPTPEEDARAPAEPEDDATPEAKPVDMPPLLPEVDPQYAIVVFKSAGGRLSVEGRVPDGDAERQLGDLLGGFGAFDRVAVDPAAPESFAASLFAGLEALSGLNSGNLSFEAGVWSLSGYAALDTDRDDSIALLRALPDFASWEVSIVAPSVADLCRHQVGTFMAGREIVFASASYRLSGASESVLSELAEKLALCPGVPVYVEGHTDSDGNAAANLTLSVMRAETVVDALVDLGVSPSRLYAVGYGDSLPIASNQTSEGKRQNRRIVFSFEDMAVRQGE